MHNSKDLISSFEDTLEMFNTPRLLAATDKAISATRVYEENFTHTHEGPTYNQLPWQKIEVLHGTSFYTAKKYIGMGKIAVLNFANPHIPGGGVTRGAMAQEECLCRSSNLYPCLLSDIAKSEYYEYNIKNTDNYFSDRIVYTDNVTVFKNDNPVPQLMPEHDWFQIDVITCAAPYMANETHIDKTYLSQIFKSRITNILETALENNVSILILGAFGCGAFKNPPDLVAHAFKEVIYESYLDKFDRFVFAIKSTVNEDPYVPCPNIMAFEEAFYKLSAEKNKLRFSDGQFSFNTN